MATRDESMSPTAQKTVVPTAPSEHVASRFIADCSARLHLGHVATTTAMVLAHRYYATQEAPHSYPQHEDIGAASIFLATKITEKPRKLRDVMNVAHCASHNVNAPLSNGPEYAAFKERLLDAEQNVLRAIRFDMDVALPYQHLLNYTKFLGSSRLVVQIALTLASDLFYAPRALDFAPHVIAATCIYVAMDLLQIAHEPVRWWHHFDTSDDDIADVRAAFVSLYAAILPPSGEGSTS